MHDLSRVECNLKIAKYTRPLLLMSMDQWLKSWMFPINVASFLFFIRHFNLFPFTYNILIYKFD